MSQIITITPPTPKLSLRAALGLSFEHFQFCSCGRHCRESFGGHFLGQEIDISEKLWTDRTVRNEQNWLSAISGSDLGREIRAFKVQELGDHFGEFWWLVLVGTFWARKSI